jgi:hypothetical protein
MMELHGKKDGTGECLYPTKVGENKKERCDLLFYGPKG